MQYRSCYEDTREVPNLNTNLKVKLMANSQCALSNQNIVEQLKETAKKNTWKLHRPQGLMVNYSLCEKLNKTPAEKMFFFCVYYISQNKTKNQQPKYRTMFFYYTENHMQKFRWFWEKTISSKIITYMYSVVWFFTKSFNCSPQYTSFSISLKVTSWCEGCLVMNAWINPG